MHSTLFSACAIVGGSAILVDLIATASATICGVWGYDFGAKVSVTVCVVCLLTVILALIATPKV